MNDRLSSRGRAHFERLYQAAEDPWHFRDSAYELGKYAATLAALPRQRFCHGLEVGCSIGELTWQLGHRCAAMLAIDTAAAPLAIARARCADMGQVRFAQMHVPAEWPDETFDLIVLSEILYFLTQADIAAVAARVRASLARDGVVLLVNWLGPTDDPCTGEAAADHFIAVSSPHLRPLFGTVGEGYRIDVLVT
jgi:2-polyprenyl-3-methyl-5-hydroxy-6-metoxy-1,4-benzoquinol methylase